MGIRFHVQPRCVPAAVAARRIGVTEARFREIAEDLLDNGFPLPDSVTGNYDLDAIDRYIAKRNPSLLGEQDDGLAVTSEDEMLRRIRAMGG